MQVVQTSLVNVLDATLWVCSSLVGLVVLFEDLFEFGLEVDTGPLSVLMVFVSDLLQLFVGVSTQVISEISVLG